MNKQEIVLMMQAAFDEANRSLCVQNGTDPAQIEESIAKSEMTVEVMMGEVFNKLDRKSTRLNSSHITISYAVFCLKKKKNM